MHLLSFVACLLLGAGSAQAQTQTRAPRPAVSVQVTDASGGTLTGVTVKLMGPVNREGKTDLTGSISFTNLRAGSFRLHFEHEKFVTLERDITVRTTTGAPIDVTLTPAPPAPKVEAPPPPPTVKPVVPRTTERPRLTSVPNFVEDNFIARAEPKKESNLGCMGTATATLIQLRDPLTEHAHADSDEMLYIVAGEAALKLDGGEEVLQAGAFSTVPMGMTHSLTRRGRNPVVVLSILSGQPCRPGETTAAARPLN